jgi:hypothetical protein
MTACEAIERAEGILPGEPAGTGRDPRWQALVRVGRHISDEPEVVWQLVDRWGGDTQEDLRDAIAQCLVEPLLETHFDDIFPLLGERAIADQLFADMLLRCQRYGQASEGKNARQLESLQRQLNEKFFD